MKVLLLTLGLALKSLSAQAVTSIQCGASGNAIPGFTATLDGKNFDPGSGYYQVENAKFQIEFVTADLNCAVGTVTDITCLGFWFGITDYPFELKIQSVDGKTVASTTNFAKAPTPNYQSLDCVVK